MAFSLSQLRNSILTSIHGRRLGLDDKEFLVGPKGHRCVITDATSDTTGTGLPNHGLISVVTTTDDTWVLDDPIPGTVVKIGTGSSSTGAHAVSLGNATCVSTNGIASNLVTLKGGRAHVELTGISTSKWRITATFDTTINFAAVVFTS